MGDKEQPSEAFHARLRQQAEGRDDCVAVCERLVALETEFMESAHDLMPIIGAADDALAKVKGE